MDSMNKTMTAAEFQQLGLLQEINRRILHPIGLALAVEVEDGTGHVLGIADELIDHRDDLEGMIYPVLGPTREARARWLDADQATRHAVRRRALGYVVQPIGSELADGWRAPSDHPAIGVPALAALDIGDNTGAGIDEIWAIVYWNGSRWVDVNGAVWAGTDISLWMLGWRPLPAPPSP